MNPSRRELLESVGIAAAGLTIAGYTSTAKGFAANEAITVGCIGTGGRCRRLMQSLATIPGVKAYTALGLATRVPGIENFPRPRSLANFWGLTPGCRNSGEAKQRLGSITKQGSALARFLLGQLVLHVLRRDGVMREWFRRIKRRRGAKIARVAVMRRLATIIWHMVKHQQPYQLGGRPAAPAEATMAAES